MKCESCGCHNPIRAAYCQQCGKPLSQAKQLEAYHKTFWGKLDHLIEKIKTIRSIKNLEIITGNIFVRIIILAALAGILILNIITNGLHIRLQNGADYSIAYYKEYNEYYILTDEEAVNLEVYFPSTVKEAVIHTYNGNGEVTNSTIDLENTSGLRVQRTDSEYYVITAVTEFGNEDSIVFYVCDEGVLNEED